MFLITVPYFNFHLESYTICNCAFNHVFFIYCLTLQLNRKHHNGKDHICSSAFAFLTLYSGSAPSMWSGVLGHMSQTLFPPSAQPVLSSNCVCALFGDLLTLCFGFHGSSCPESPSELPQMLKWHPIWGSVEKIISCKRCSYILTVTLLSFSVFS